ncbi:4-aminobutyrate--2-oxoglutarate transaminase [Streptomyces sp. NPDC059460]|uniref:4-aminobutyrate--2-oxoglutarate transaminase n=1 Tax=Streptomyces sp. NPDC059460 TaxID=3346840 RepID=UPI0036CA8540
MSDTDQTTADLGAPPAGGPGIAQVRKVVTEIPGPRSRELLVRQRTLLPSGVESTLPVFIEAAGGGVVVDADGNSLIDFGSGIAVTTVGNSADAVVRRAAAQLGRFTHTCFLANPYRSYLDVCEKLNEIAPVPGAKRTVLVNSGAEAVENAVKIARAATGRPGIVVFDHAYHGRTLLTMTLTAKNRPYKQGFGPFAPEVHRAPMAYPFRWPSGPERCAEEAADALADLLDRQVGSDNVAAVLIEPIQGEGGFVVPAPGFLPRVAAICRERGILLIADEVQTGIARTGRMFACEHEGIEPDLLTTAKGLGGGLPLGAVTGRAELMDAVPAGGLGGTYSGNPVACEAALGVFEEIEQHGLVERAMEIGGIMLDTLDSMRRSHPLVGDVRGRGAMIAIELVEPGNRPAPHVAARIAARCHAEGLLVLTAGSYGNVLRFLPPLSIGNDLLEEGLAILRSAVAAEAAAM